MKDLKSRFKVKDKVQANAVKLSKKHRFICLEWSTGVGKTLGALKIVDRILSEDSSAKGYLVCKETTHKKNWILDMKKHGYDHILNSTSTILYASLKSQNAKADFVILDECHSLTEGRILHLSKVVNPGCKIILLSATINQSKRDLIDKYFSNVHYNKIPLTKAIKLGLLPEPKLFVHKMQLKTELDEDKTWKLQIRKPKAKKGETPVTRTVGFSMVQQTLSTSPNSVGIVGTGTEAEYYEAICKQIEYYKGLSEDYSIAHPVRVGCRHKWLNLASQRKNFIAEVKTRRLKGLVGNLRLSNKRFICFAGNIEQAKLLGADHAVHSGNNNKHNQELIDLFNGKDNNELFAVKMLREGVNLTDIEAGVITQLDSDVGTFFQMLGRCLRNEFPVMHLLVIENTQDAKYYTKAMKGFDKKYIKEIKAYE